MRSLARGWKIQSLVNHSANDWSNVMCTSLFSSLLEIDRQRLWYMFGHTHYSSINKEFFSSSSSSVCKNDKRHCRTISCNNTRRRIHFNWLEKKQLLRAGLSETKNWWDKKGKIDRYWLIEAMTDKYKQNHRLVKMSNGREKNICLFALLSVSNRIDSFLFFFFYDG